MLKHEDSPQLHPTPAAEVRVTPEELAAAITRIEARKDAGQRNLEGTVAIGEVVQQLGLDATPEEVLAEVQSGRTRQDYLGKRLSPKRRLRLLLATGAAFVGFTTFWASSYFSGSPSYDVHTMPIASYGPNTALTPVPIAYDPNLVVADGSGKLMMLSEVRDNQPVTCGFDGVSFQKSTSLNAFSWTLIKHDGKVYVRGWIQQMTPKVLQEEGADVSTSKNYASIPVTLPMDGIIISDTQAGPHGESFHATGIHLDKHAYEKW